MSPTNTKPNPPSGSRPSASPMARGGLPGGGAARMMFSGEKAHDFRGTMRILLRYLRPFMMPIMFVFFCAVASTVFTIISPKLLGQMTDRIVDGYINMKTYDGLLAHLPAGVTLKPGTTGADLLKNLPPAAVQKIPASQLDRVRRLDLSHRPVIDFAGLKRTAFILIALYLFSAIFSYIQGWLMTGIAQRIAYQFRRDISEKINRLPLKYFDTRTHGEVLSRVTNDVDTVSQTLNQSLTQIVTSVTTVVGILIMMFSISWMMTLVALLMLPVSFVLIGLIVRRSQRYFKAQQDTLGHLNGHVEEMYGGHVVMRVNGGEQASVAQFNRINHRLYDSAWKSQFFSGLMWPITGFIGNLGYVGVSVLGGWLAVNGRLQIGDIQAFIQYLNQFNQPIIQMANTASILQSTAAAAERVFEFLGEAEESPDPAHPVRLTEVKGAVAFDNISFGYDPEKPVIHDFEAKITPGQRIAIVGPTGAGKTTMVNLLMRFYEVNGGSIQIDGTDVRELKRSDLRSLFGMVLQDTWLFNGSIRENLAYGKPSASEEEIEEAARAAHADHFIRALPGGYSMELNEEADNLSQGEKQLLTIARAMLADPPMLILDEATSSVDTRTEVLIQEAMERLMEGRTSFVIAHRLSTIREADLILVMRDGTVIEQGKHAELLEQDGFYAAMYQSQFAKVEG